MERVIINILCILCFSLVGRTVLAADSVAEVLFTKGKVEVIRMNYTLEARGGMKLLPNDVVITGNGSSALINYEDSSRKIRLKQNSKVHLMGLNE